MGKINKKLIVCLQEQTWENLADIASGQGMTKSAYARNAIMSRMREDAAQEKEELEIWERRQELLNARKEQTGQTPRRDFKYGYSR